MQYHSSKGMSMQSSLISWAQNLFSATRSADDFELMEASKERNFSTREPRAQRGFFHDFSVVKLFSRACLHLFGDASVPRVTLHNHDAAEENGGANRKALAAGLEKTLAAMSKKDAGKAKEGLKALEIMLDDVPAGNRDQALKAMVRGCLLSAGKSGVNSASPMLLFCGSDPWQADSSINESHDFARQLYSDLARTFESEWTTMFTHPSREARKRS